MKTQAAARTGSQKFLSSYTNPSTLSQTNADTLVSLKGVSPLWIVGRSPSVQYQLEHLYTTSHSAPVASDTTIRYITRPDLHTSEARAQYSPQSD